MFPIGDTNVRNSGPGVVTIVLIIINVLVFIYQLMMSEAQLQGFYEAYAVQPAEILRGQDLHALLTSMFMHGGWLHIASNMLFLWVFGDNIEAALGKVLYLGFYLAGGLAASFAHIIFNPGSMIPSLGASGAIAAVLGAYIVMFPSSQVRLLMMTRAGSGITRVSALMFLGVWAITQLFSGVASLGAESAQTSGVAFWAHIGGFVFGLVVGFLLRGRASNLQLERPQ
jgi:membrane associated rhomboid family serine protease